MSLIDDESRRRSYDIDIVKMIAILGVMWLHYFGQVTGWHVHWVGSAQFLGHWTPFSWTQLGRFISAFGYLGVNLFVIASGFCLQSSLLRKSERISYLQFMKCRYARLVPHAMLASGIVWLMRVVWLEDWPRNDLFLNLLPFLAGVNLFTDQTFFPSINGELWFLGLIIQLYLLFPILISLLDRIKTWRFLLILFLISASFRLCCVLWLRHHVNVAAYGWCFGRLFEFGFGMCVARSFHHGRLVSRWWTLGLFLFWGYFWWWSFPFADILMGVGLFAVIWVGSKHLPESELVKALAKRSYSLFLLHHPVIWLFNKIGIQDTWTVRGGVGFGLFILIAVGMAGILDLVVENRKRFWIATVCTYVAVLCCLLEKEANEASVVQSYAISNVLRHGGVIEQDSFGNVIGVRLEGATITDGVADLVLQFPRVTKVSLYGSSVTDAAVIRLRSLGHLSSLGLQGTQVTDASLGPLATMGNLRHVWLPVGEFVSEAGLRRLSKTRPDLVVHMLE